MSGPNTACVARQPLPYTSVAVYGLPGEQGLPAVNPVLPALPVEDPATVLNVFGNTIGEVVCACAAVPHRAAPSTRLAACVIRRLPFDKTLKRATILFERVDDTKLGTMTFTSFCCGSEGYGNSKRRCDALRTRHAVTR